MKLTRYGRREWLGYGIASGVLICISCVVGIVYNEATGGYIVSAVILFFYGCLAAFFRDPSRRIPETPGVLLSPADGVIRDIELIKNSEENAFFSNKGVIRIGIFLSVFDVHINRAPCTLTVVSKKYKKGRFLDARNPRASIENESMTLYCNATVDGKTFPLIIRQISGAIAKRIVCDVEEGGSLSRGQQFGMLKFGSRTELFLPAEQWIHVGLKVGDRVSAGLTTMASIKDTNDKPRNKE